jgi:hypothetical protein
LVKEDHVRKPEIRALAALICLAANLITTSAAAITVEVAKKCNELTAKAYPPRVVGKPAAGSAKKETRKRSEIISVNAWRMVASWTTTRMSQPSDQIPSRQSRLRLSRRCLNIRLTSAGVKIRSRKLK